MPDFKDTVSHIVERLSKKEFVFLMGDTYRDVVHEHLARFDSRYSKFSDIGVKSALGGRVGYSYFHGFSPEELAA